MRDKEGKEGEIKGNEGKKGEIKGSEGKKRRKEEMNKILREGKVESERERGRKGSGRRESMGVERGNASQ